MSTPLRSAVSCMLQAAKLRSGVGERVRAAATRRASGAGDRGGRGSRPRSPSRRRRPRRRWPRGPPARRAGASSADGRVSASRSPVAARAAAAEATAAGGESTAPAAASCRHRRPSRRRPSAGGRPAASPSPGGRRRSRRCGDRHPAPPRGPSIRPTRPKTTSKPSVVGRHTEGVARRRRGGAPRVSIRAKTASTAAVEAGGLALLAEPRPIARG